MSFWLGVFMVKIILMPGNGGTTIEDSWYPSVKKAFQENGFEVVARTFPDNVLARASYWLPFMRDELRVDENTVLIGHSSGAVAAMRYAEEHKILGSVLVGTYWTHLNIESEIQSGYFGEPWQWQQMKKNQEWSMVFASSDDPYIPISEPRFVAEQLASDYVEYSDKGHFLSEQFPELVRAVIKKIQKRRILLS